MHVFKLSVIAGSNNPQYAEGTVTQAMCLADAESLEAARDRTLFQLNALGFESCTILDVARLPAGTDITRMSPAVQQAHANAKHYGVALIVYPPGTTAG